MFACEDLQRARMALAVVLLAWFWAWESWQPFFGHPEGRGQHAIRNLGLALGNTLVLGLLFGFATITVTGWTAQNQWGILNAFDLAGPARCVATFLVLDAWMYVWHRANHAIPCLWRFHRTHHSDPHMDVTTATRFHLGEHLGAVVLRLGLVPLVGLEVWDLLVYDTAVIAVTQFHHADISLGRWDRWLRPFIVTPAMHKVHHSAWRPETDSNYSTVLSVWDRLGRSFRLRSDLTTLVFGLREFTDDSWQSWWGMWKTPFVHAPADPFPKPDTDEADRHEARPGGPLQYHSGPVSAKP